MSSAVGRSTAVRVGGAALAMIVVAEAAVWLLSPRDRPPDPVPVEAADLFSAAELERAEDYRGGQRALALVALGLEGAVLAAVAFGRPATLRRRLERLDSRPLVGAALAGAAVSLLTALVTLPTGLAAHERSVDAGISTQSLSSWLWDLTRSIAIGTALAALGAVLLFALVRRFPRRWWLPGSAAVAALAVLLVWIAPVLLAPIFNRFEELPKDSPARAEVVELGERAGVEIGEVYRVDASRRVTSLNAYVDGIGSSKRVVLYDNLLERAERPQLEAVVAHELAHVANHDIPRGLAFVAIVAPFGLLFSRELAGAILVRRGVEPRSPAAVPAYLLALALAATALGIAGNELSRQIERAADAYAVELTGDPEATIDLQLELARTNLSDPDPPGFYSALFATHPSTVERVGAALAVERESGGGQGGSGAGD